MHGGHRNIIKYIDPKMRYYHKSETGWVKSTKFCIATGLYQADIVAFILPWHIYRWSRSNESILNEEKTLKQLLTSKGSVMLSKFTIFNNKEIIICHTCVCPKHTRHFV